MSSRSHRSKSPSRSPSPSHRSHRTGSGRHTHGSPSLTDIRGQSTDHDYHDTRSSPPPRRIRSLQQSKSHSTRDNCLTQDQERIRDLERQLASARNSKEKEGRKRKAPEPLDNMSAMRRGRAIPKLVAVYEDIHTLLAQYDEYRHKGYHQLDSEGDDDDIDIEEKRRLQRGYAGIMTLYKTVYPDFLKKIKEPGSAHIIRELQTGANSSRAFDTSTVMKFVGDVLNEEVRKINQAKLKEYQVKLRAYTENVTTGDSASDFPTATTNTMAEPVLERVEEFCTTSRDNRGLQNDVTGYLLCPAEFDWNDTAVRAAVRAFDPNYDFASSAHARCFYKDEEFDPDDFDKGFLQSYLLVQVYRLMFTSPSSTKDQPQDVENLPASKKKKTTGTNHRGNVAQIIHMNDVKPRSIAYAAVHLHFALSDASQWTNSHMGYNYLDLWNFIVDFFEDPEGEEEEQRSKELLKWWNDRIFTGTRAAANSRGTKMTSRKQDVSKRLRVASPLHDIFSNGTGAAPGPASST
ncbi:uncharacterized protein C8R40DRAFT_1175702 [Lentinula edodes]|uniref:uncharacterized protein n=1 Tax=Lentinula edodes TaxID=5353 RepID=UPI001E8CF20B|nr:uncharacterized protein C8R40DRAFT_1175702 [Lentinula edodes]KAH7870438.1 hypothetical protein C8R40DRAFT_1175702 [Lentinula edodes]